jgi:hypothetical protein
MRGSKDAAIAFAARSFLNGRLSAIGEVTEITLDTGRRRARLRVTLRGEPVPIDVELREYRLEQGNGGDWLRVVEAVASRDWLTAALRQFAVGRRFHIPPKAARTLQLLT